MMWGKHAHALPCLTVSLNTHAILPNTCMYHLAEHVRLTFAIFTRGCCHCFMSISEALTAALPLRYQQTLSPHPIPLFFFLLFIACLPCLISWILLSNKGQGEWNYGSRQGCHQKKKACYAHSMAACIAQALSAPYSVQTQLGLTHITRPAWFGPCAHMTRLGS